MALDPERKRALLATLLRDGARPAEQLGPRPLSFTQRQMWLLEQIEPETAAYNVPLAFDLRGMLDITALQRALNEIVRRHAVLRAIVVDVDGEPFSRIEPAFALALPIVALEGSERLDALLARESARRFDLEALPAIRALLVRIGAGEHVLLVTFHHFVVDGWSIGVFNRELGILYNAYAADVVPALAALRSNYADFSTWQRERVAGPLLERSLNYWREQMQDAPPYLDFPGRHESSERSVKGSVRTRVIDRATAAALLSFARTHRTTLFATLLTMVYVLLWRYTGQSDLVVGCAVANRRRSEDEALIGFFVNTLPLRASLAGDPSFPELLARVHAMTLGALDNAEIPFAQLIEELNPARIAGRTPFASVMFVLQNAPHDALTLDGLEATPIAVNAGNAKLDLTLQCVESVHGLTASIDYRTSVFDEATIDGLLEAFETLAGALVESVDAPVSRLPLVSARARQIQLGALDRGARRQLSGGRLETLFEWHARSDPAHVALVCGTESVSYGALNERANRLAHHLRSLGVTSGSAVGICLERGCSAIVAILAVVKAGGAYVPLDPDYPIDRLAFMLADSGASVTIAERRFIARLGVRAEIVILDDEAAWSTCVSTNPGAAGGDDGVANIMYTSGSTGTPKGVLVAHRGIELLVNALFDVALGPLDTLVQGTTLTFDPSTFEIWAALCNGASIAIVSKTVLLATDELANAIETYHATVLFLPTALFREIVRKAPSTFRALRLLVIGGEEIDADSVSLLVASQPPQAFINGYGPTEATVFATYFPLDLQGAVPATIPIGRPIANTEVLLLDEALQLVPWGARGQLFIGGPGVALGYINNPELTKTKFVAHPWRPQSAGRLYATGDYGRFTPTGDIQFLGRLDQQLKVRGFRIEPAEIETALRACPGVDDAVVVLHDDRAGSRKLVGYVVTAAPDRIDTESITRMLRKNLPAQCIPDVLVPLAALPLTTSGKLDRRALPAPSARPTAAVRAVAPTSELQHQLMRLWERLLDVHPIGITDDFFALGGHSLLAVRMIGELEREFATRLPVAVLFAAPTIEQLALVLRNDGNSLNRSALRTFNGAGTAPPLFFLHGSLNGGGFYCLALARELGPDRPVHVLRPQGTDGGAIPATIEAIATDYLNLITATQPHGPYLLGGFCSGGLVAFEMARQLSRRNERVANVILLDAPHPGYGLTWIATAIDRAACVLRLPPTISTGVLELIRRPLHVVDRLAALPSTAALARKIAAKLRARLSRRNGATLVEPASLEETWTTISRCYIPRRYAGRLTIFSCLSGPREPHVQDWSTVSPRAEIRWIPGDHFSCVTDNIATTASAIATALQL